MTKKWYHHDDESKQFLIGAQPVGWEEGMSEEFKKRRRQKSIETKIKKYGSLEEANKVLKEKREKTMLEKYGVTSNFKDPNSLKKREQTWLKKYGVTNPNQNTDVRQKTKQTCLKKYGTSCTLNNIGEEELNRRRIEKFGSLDNYWAVQKEKHIKTNLEKYGAQSYLETEEFQKKRAATLIKKYGSLEEYYKQQQLKMKKTSVERFGTTNVFGSTHFKSLMTDEKKQARIKKANETKIKNKSFNTSTDEFDLYNLLCKKYGAEDILSPYTSPRYADETGYQFKCDFYVKSKDLFIELNDHWTHGGHAFNPNDVNDIATLKTWNEKAQKSKFFKNAIYVWTELDVKKQRCAKKNKLNYITIYRKEDIDESKL